MMSGISFNRMFQSMNSYRSAGLQARYSDTLDAGGMGLYLTTYVHSQEEPRPEAQEAHEVGVTNGIAGLVQTQQDLENETTVEFTDGFIVDGYDKPVTLDLPWGQGPTAVKLSKDKQTLSTGELNVKLYSNSRQASNARATTARIEGAVPIAFKVYPTGGLAVAGRHDRLQGAIKTLKGRRDYSVENFKEDDNGNFYWIARGVMKVKRATKHTHHWY